MLRPGSRQGAEAEDADVMAVAPFPIGECAVNHRVAGDVILAVRAQRESQPNIVNARQEIKRGPRPVGWRSLAGFHSQYTGVIWLGLAYHRRIGKERDRMNRRSFVALARVLPVHLAININGHKTGFIESDQNLAVLDGARGRLASRMHRGGTNRLAVDASDFDFHGTGSLEVHIRVRPAR